MGKRLIITKYNSHIAGFLFWYSYFLSRIWVVEMRGTEAGKSVKLHNKNKSFNKAVGKQKSCSDRKGGRRVYVKSHWTTTEKKDNLG